MNNSDDCSKAILAVYNNDKSSLELMISKGCSSCVDDLGDSILFACLDAENVNFTEMLLEAGSDPLSRTFTNNTILHRSAFRGKEEFVRLLIKHQKNLDLEGSDGLTALHYAVKANHWNIVDMLLEAGANPDIPDWHGVTAASGIHYFYKTGKYRGSHEHIKKFLISRSRGGNPS